MNYELRVTCRGNNKDFSVESYDVIMADNLVSLLSQFILLIATLHRRELEEANVKNDDDDIPF
jgi:hypothetical protein